MTEVPNDEHTPVITEFIEAPTKSLEYQPYDPSQDREKMRGWLAWGLLALITIVVIGSFVAVAYLKIEIPIIREWLTIIFGPLTTLFGAITGFYFGEKAKG